MPRFQHAFDRPFTVKQSVAAGQNFGGVAPTVTFTAMVNGAEYAESATGTAGLFTFHPKWDLDILRVTLDMPGDQASYTVNIVEDGVTTVWFSGGGGITDVITLGPMPLRADGSIQVVTTGAPTGVITARITVRRSDIARMGYGS